MLLFEIIENDHTDFKIIFTLIISITFIIKINTLTTEWKKKSKIKSHQTNFSGEYSLQIYNIYFKQTHHKDSGLVRVICSLTYTYIYT